MKIALIGIRGIPVIYSGFESFAENLATALALKKNEVYVYCRSPYVDKRIQRYKNVNLITLFTVRSKNFESIIHSFLATFHACFILKSKIIYYFGVGNAIFTLLPRFFGIKTIINVDGLDWKREKWGPIAKIYLKYSEFIATIFPNETITDSLFIKKYYRDKYNKETVYIPYGFDENLNKTDGSLKRQLFKKYGLKAKKYFVWVGRIVPENHLEELIIAFKKLKTDFKCLIIGDDLYKTEYKENINKPRTNSNKIIFTGFLSKNEYAVLVKNSFCYVETKRSGGTHPSLMEAMGLSCFIVSNDSTANKQILKDSAVYYDIKNSKQSLLKELNKIIDKDYTKKREKFIFKAKKIVKNDFSLNAILKKYTNLFSYTE